MYHAKAGGKARHEVFNQHMHDEAVARLQLGNDLRRALEHDEFCVFYQPIVELRTGRVHGFEALVRWDHPDRGLLSPLHFIEHTEETGMIVALGRSILRKACEQLSAWNARFPDRRLTMSVNVSRRQIVDPAIVDDVRTTLESTGVEPASLKLEITESVIMADPDATARVLGELKNLGVQIHMDDFGTGYSSLSCLHRFPIDVVKIDREFMTTMDGNHGYAGVVHTVVVLAHKLNMRVTVEGVETEGQLSQLRALEADYAQGFHIARPLPPERAEHLIAADRRWLYESVA
jgi:EAL domain-containing protein (putative c-di-GMP-specific phosphodiesterase class I)